MRSRRRYGRRRGPSRRRYHRRSYRRSRRGSARRRAPRLRTLRHRSRRVHSFTRRAPLTATFGIGAPGTNSSLILIPQPGPLLPTIAPTAGGFRITQNPTLINSVYYAAFSFQPFFDQIPNVLDFSGNYDQFRIMKCVLRFRGYSGVENEPNTAAGIAPGAMGIRLHSIIDHDGEPDFTLATPQNDLQSICAHLSYHNDLLGTNWSRIMNPAVSIPVMVTQAGAGPGTVANSGPRYRQWMDMRNAREVRHYGMYGIFEIDGGITSQYKDFAVEVEYHIQCRNPF